VVLVVEVVVVVVLVVVVVVVGGGVVVVVVVLVVLVVDVVVVDVVVVEVDVVVVDNAQTTGKKIGSAHSPVGTIFIVVVPSGTFVYNPGANKEPIGILVKKGTKYPSASV
jgi:hypothetical protein